MSARRSSANTADLDLSLTGSQFSTLSLTRPSSAKPGKRPNSASGIRPHTGLTNGVGSDGSTKGSARKKHARAGSHSGSISNRSDISSASSVRGSSKLAKNKPKDDFLALFESSTPPKIMQSKTKKSTTSKLWSDKSLKTNILSDRSLLSPGNLNSPMFDGTRPKTYSHSVFQPASARSTSTVDSDYGDVFIRKSNGLDNNFDKNINDIEDNDAPVLSNALTRRSNDEPVLTNAFTRRSNDIGRSTLSRQSNDFERSRSHDREPTGLSSSFRKSNGEFSKSSTFRKSNDLVPSIANSLREGGDISPSPKVPNEQVPLTNNMTSQAQGRATKMSVSSIENIKHKMPVNQVKETQGNLKPVVGRNVAEDYIKKVNMAATKIQRFYWKYLKRKRTSLAAMKRLMSQKREEVQNQLQTDTLVTATRSEEEKRKAREEKAHAARQQAIQELHKKRQEKQIENQRIAEEEVRYLQETGKVSRNPTRGKKKVLTKTRQKKTSTRDSESDGDEGSPASAHRPATASSVGRIVDDIFQNETPRNNSARMEDDSATDITDTAITEQSEERRETETPSNAGTKTTLNDIMHTLKLLEHEEKFPTPRNEMKNSWVDDDDPDTAGYLSADKLEKLNHPIPSKSLLTKSGNLTDAKLKSIMSFLDEVDTAERLSEIDQELVKVNELLEKPAILVPSADEIAQLEQASVHAAEVTNTVLAQRLELDERTRSITMLQKALNQQRELTVRHAKETEKEMKKRINVQKDEYEETIKRHLSFIDQLIDDKKDLSEKCELLVKEIKQVDKKYSDKLKQLDDGHVVEMTKLKETHSAAEKLRRERWIDEKTKKIKEMTVKGLEPEIQRLIAKHKNEVKKIKSIHEAELLRSDERAGQRYIEMTEQLRDQLAKEKEAACQRERELAAARYEKQMQQEEEAYQAQRRRMYQEVQEEKDRLSQQAARQRAEIDKLQRQLEDTHTHSVDAMKEEYEKARDEQERRHTAEIRSIKDKLEVEKQSWEENYMKKQETWMLQKERELKEQVRRDRDKEIEMVISRLEEDTLSTKEECERAAENRIKRIRDKYDSEMNELERSERQAMEKYNEMKARLLEIEGENGRFKVIIRQKDQEIKDVQKMSEKLNTERDHVQDIVRQEFADKLVATDEENKRLKLEMAEQKSRHRLELERGKAEIEVIQKSKEEEMDEVHKRVKNAIVRKEETVNQLRQQYQAAVKRADHLEGLLEQQRKQLLKKK